LIQRKGKHYSKSIDVYRKLALEVDIELAKSKSETFRKFLECIKGLLMYKINLYKLKLKISSFFLKKVIVIIKEYKFVNLR
jgi:hypothetical protein